MWRLVRKLTPLQVEKYDITQKIILELACLESRIILFSIKTKSKTAEEIIHDCRIPRSTVYKKLTTMIGLALIHVEKFDFSSNGHPEKFYRSRIDSANIRMEGFEPKLILKKNKDTNTHKL